MVQMVYCANPSRDSHFEDLTCQHKWSIQDNYFVEPPKFTPYDKPECLLNCQRFKQLIWLGRTSLELSKLCKEPVYNKYNNPYAALSKWNQDYNFIIIIGAVVNQYDSRSNHRLKLDFCDYRGFLKSNLRHFRRYLFKIDFEYINNVMQNMH